MIQLAAFNYKIDATYIYFKKSISPIVLAEMNVSAAGKNTD